MSKPKQPGYLIPENPAPEDLLCLKVWIPKDDLYLYAFAGAYQYFSKWTAWERSNDNRAALAAAAWKNAYYYTLENGWINCGEDVCNCQDEIDEIIARLEELENMNINVNCGCGCGCQQSQPCDPTDITDDDVTMPPGDEETGDIGQQQKCNISNYFIYALRLGVINTISQAYSLYDPWWQALWELSGGFEPIRVNWAIWSAIRAWFVGRTITEFTSTFDPMFDSLVCTLFNSQSSTEARENLDAALNALPIPWRYVTRAMTGNLPYATLFIPGTISLPAGFENRQCCGSVPPGDDVELPPAATGYAWLPISPAHLEFTGRSFPEGGTPLEVVGNGYMRVGFQPGTIGNSNWDILYDEIETDLRLPSPGDDTVGLAMFLTEVEHTEDGGSPQAQWVSPTGGGINWYVDSAPANPVPVLSGFIHGPDAFATEIAPLFDYADDGNIITALQVAHQIGGAGPKNIITYCRMYWLVKL